MPTFKAAFLAILRRFQRAGVEELSGHELYALCEEEYAAADAWLEKAGFGQAIAAARRRPQEGRDRRVDAALEKVFDAFVDTWQHEAGISTYARGRGQRHRLPPERGRRTSR